MKKKILLLAAHPDDLEFGMGATISKLKREGHKIKAIVLSDCDILEELQESMEILKTFVNIYQIKVRTFPSKRQDILDLLIYWKNKFKPDIVYLPCSFDIHQDHSTVHQEGVRAFKHSILYGYSFYWNNLSEELRHFEIVLKEDMEKKVAALACYESQKDRYYFDWDLEWKQAELNGRIINQQYVERFELIRSIK